MGDLKDVKVVVTRVSNVVPLQASPSYSYPLSDIDVIFESNFYFDHVAFYDANDGIENISEFMDGLKQSLSKALVQFPILAGRFQRNKDSGRLEVDVNAKGVPFIEAMADARLGDWKDLRYCHIDRKLNPENVLNHIYEAPLIRIQVTRFKCGGVALGFGYLHSTMDGYSVIQFLQAWGELHRGLPISNPPKFMSSLTAVAREPAPPTSREMLELLELEDSPLRALAEVVEAQKHDKQVENIIFHLEEELVNELIKEIDSGPSKRHTQATSSHIAVSALLWCSVTRARGIAADVDVSYTIPISLRGKGRFEPPLPNGFFGNALILELASAKACELTDNHISNAASLLYETIKKVGPDSGRKHIEWLASCRGKPKLAHIDSKKDVRNTTFASFPVFQVEFGWGKMKHFRYSLDSLELAEGLTIILPSSKGGRSREVSITLLKDHMEKLIADPMFSKYCKH